MLSGSLSLVSKCLGVVSNWSVGFVGWSLIGQLVLSGGLSLVSKCSVVVPHWSRNDQWWSLIGP